MEVYLDNAATSFPKPPKHIEYVTKFMTEIGGSAGRSGHRKAIAASQLVEDTRTNLAEILNVFDPSRIVFSYNATDSLNLAIKGLVKPSSQVIVSSLEHNSVIRPLRKLQNECNVRVIVLQCDTKGNLDSAEVKRAVTKDTSLIITTHASNVTGTILPIHQIAETAFENSVPYVVDATQTAGALPISLADLPPLFLAFAGHKGLLGAQGTGGLVLPDDFDIPSQREGGTGSQSENEFQPELIPDKFESGTLNCLGISGLKGGTEYVLEKNVLVIRQHEMNLTARLLEGLRSVDGVQLYGEDELEKRVGVVSFNISGYHSGDVSQVLDREYNILSRSGLHCAPLAHRTMGTLKQGTVRLSVGPFNSEDDISLAIEAIRRIASAV